MKIALAPGVRVRPDPRDGVSVLIGPERGLRLSPTAAEIVSLCDGTRTLPEIVQALHERFEGDTSRVEADVTSFVGQLQARGWVREAVAPDVRPESTAAGSEPAALSADGSRPYTLVAELTHRCPLACPYCSNPLDLVGGPGELTTDEWRRVIEDAAALGVMQVHLSGGEPLARADLEVIADAASRLDLYVNLITSGLPLEADRWARLAPSLDHVQLSVQDSDAEASDWIAGTAAFEQKMRVAAWVKERGLPLTLNVVLHRSNIQRVEAIVALAERLGVDRLELANVQLVSWALRNRTALLPSRAQIEEARRVAAEARARLEGRMQVILVLPDWHADRPRACMDGWARRFVVVAPDGAILPCHAARALPLRFEGVRERPLAEVWRDGEALRAFRGEEWMAEPCRGCDRRSVDFGGCRCQAFALTGDVRATDPSCSLAPAHEMVVQARREAEAPETRHFVWRGRSPARAR